MATPNQVVSFRTIARQPCVRPPREELVLNIVVRGIGQVTDDVEHLGPIPARRRLDDPAMLLLEPLRLLLGRERVEMAPCLLRPG
jgi:hypothetical protein